MLLHRSVSDPEATRANTPGIRVAITARLATAILPIHVDINVGDPVSPPARPIALPRLLGGHITITGYPIAMVHAEKIVTAIQRGTANTRWRDFADIYLLSTRHPFSSPIGTATQTNRAAGSGTDTPIEAQRWSIMLCSHEHRRSWAAKAQTPW